MLESKLIDNRFGDGNNVSVSLNGTDEYFEYSPSTTSLNFGNNFTLSFWIYPTDFETGNQTIFEAEDGVGLDNYFQTGVRGDLASDPFYVLLYNNAGVEMKRFEFFSLPAENNVWAHMAFSFNGTTGDELRVYWDGADITGTAAKLTDVAGTMDNVARQTGWGSNSLAATLWNGNLGHMAHWDSVLGVNEIAQIFAVKQNRSLQSDFGNYTSSANLVGYWKPGADPTSVGRPFHNIANSFDYNADGTVDADDIDTNVP